MRDDKRRGQEFEPEHAAQGGLFYVLRGECIVAFGCERGGDGFEDFYEVCAGAAAGIEDIDVGIGEAVLEVEFFAQDGVGARDHIFDNFDRRIPHA